MTVIAAPGPRGILPRLAPAPSPPPATAPGCGGRSIGGLWWPAAALVAVGLAARLVRYFLQTPIWGDEAFVCVNFLERDYLGLTRALTHAQVAPVLFLLSELTAFRLLGSSELALRLVPHLAGVLSLGLFWHLARATLTPRAAVLAAGLLAVAHWPVAMSAFVKPYSMDLLMALVLLVPAVQWLRHPQQARWPLLMAVAVPFALLGSYPAVFVAGAASLALLPTALRSGWTARTAFVLYNLLMFASFAGAYYVVGQQQLDPERGLVNAYLQKYWENAFPPAGPGPLAKWLALTHTGRMMAYPVGDAKGGSTATFLVFAVGVAVWWRSRRWALLTLALSPFALNLIAAALHRYPYGGCCRLSQHLAPAICLLTGTGAAALIERLAAPAAQRRWTGVACLLLALCGAGSIVLDLLRPYHDTDALWMREAARQVLARAGRHDRVAFLQRVENVQPGLRWYLQTQAPALDLGGQINWDRLEQSGGSLWLLNFWLEGSSVYTDGPLPTETAARPGWTEAERLHFQSQPRTAQDATLFMCVHHWIPSEPGSVAGP
jgi:hypothetical protein